jgi:anti-anti-sigma factor
LSIDVTVRASDRCHVIALRGELDLVTAPFLTCAFEAVLPHADAVVLDLDQVSFIDSSGLVAIIACETQCRKRGVGFAMTESSPQVRRGFSVAGVTPQPPCVGRLRRAYSPPTSGRPRHRLRSR